jgi:hypothetical protein
MPRSNPHARERVKDDEKHLDSLARPFPFAGRGTSGESPAGSSQGSALQAPRRAIGDQEMLETRRVGALLQREEFLHSRLSARAGERNRSQGRRTRHPHGSLCSRWSAAMSTAASNRNVGQRPFVLLRGTSSFNRGWRLRGGSRRFVVGGPGRAPARSAGAARNRPFSGSCSRSYRCGRNRTNGVIVVEARRIRETGLRAEAKRSRGQPRRRDRRPADGRRSGSSDAWVLSRDVREKVVSTARSQAPPLPRKGGPPLAKAKRAGGVR